MDTKPIPSFYCCYLLRSTRRHASLYIGSTPCMPRRLKQHNGKAKGGAKRTAGLKLRPWEVVCLVHGFASRTAALQFERAWQNTNDTRYIPADERGVPNIRISPKTGKARKRPKKSGKADEVEQVGRLHERAILHEAGQANERKDSPRRKLMRPVSLSDHISGLHTLLRSKGFGRWPLSLLFFVEDGYRVWNAWELRFSEKLRPDISVKADFIVSDVPPSATGDFEVPKQIKALDSGYLSLKSYLQKTTKDDVSEQHRSCTVCKDEIPVNDAQCVVCPNCLAYSHLTCLANYFLTGQSDLLPVSGSCPNCSSVILWDVMVREMTLRLRGQEEIERLFKERRRRNPDSVTTMKSTDQGSDATRGVDDDVEDDGNDDDWIFQAYDDHDNGATDSEGGSSIEDFVT